MDYIFNFLLILILFLGNYLSFKKPKTFMKVRNILYLFCILILLFLTYHNIQTKEKFNQTGGAKKDKIAKLKEKCGILQNRQATSHCFNDATHQTCCLLGPKARKYADDTKNPIGEISKKEYMKYKEENNMGEFNEEEKTPWCTCLGSNVCSYYAEKFPGDTEIRFINNKNNNQIAENPDPKCERKIRRFFRTGKHGTPGIGKMKQKCKQNIKDYITVL